MAKPPRLYIESDPEFAWRLAARFPERYPLQESAHRQFIMRRILWGAFWRWVGESTGMWWPFMAWARRADLA